MRSFFLHVQRRRGDEGVDARTVGTLERRGRACDVLVVGARQRADGGVLDRVGNRLHRFEVAVRAGRETGLDDVHAQALELARDAQLLVARHRGTRRLLAVAQVVSKITSFSVIAGSWV
jgi:hypothetical protein